MTDSDSREGHAGRAAPSPEAGRKTVPLISCICITQNRRLFLRQAIVYFDVARDVFEGETELVILDGSERSSLEMLDNAFSSLRVWNNVRYFHEPSPPHAKTGVLHNRACELARGDIIVQWDDDDWQSPDRIVKQVATLQARGEPSFTFTSRFYWYHLAERRACKARSWHPGLGTAGATFAYHRKAWEKVPFRDVEQGEDNFFWDDLQAAGVPMIDARDPELVVYIRHNRNGSAAITDRFTDEDTLAARTLMASDIDFYDELSEILPLDEWNNPHARWHEQLNRAELFRMARSPQRR